MTELRRHPGRWSAVVAILGIALSMVILTPSFSASSLTKSAAKKLFYTKEKSDQRYYTKEEADELFTPPSAGPTTVSLSPAEWRKTNPVSGIQGNPQSTGTTFSYGGSAQIDILQLGGSFPTVLNGDALSLESFDVCYRTTDGTNDPTLSAIRLYRFDPEDQATDQLFEDGTNYTDDDCRHYPLTSPVPLERTDLVYVDLLVDWVGGGGQSFTAGATALNLSP